MSTLKNEYVMINIEHYSEHLVLVPIPDRESISTPRAFLSQVLCRFGSCAKVLTDNGTDFRGSFDEQLKALFIDNRFTSPRSPSG